MGYVSSNVDSSSTNKGATADSSFVKATPAPSPRSSVHRGRANSHRLWSATFRDSLRSRSNSIEALILEVRNAFDPNSKFIQFWHQLLLACLLYEVMAIPFLLTFKSSAEKWLTPELMAVYACEVLFVMDVYVELNTGYYEDGNVFRDAKKSWLKYIQSSRFALDMIALPPISLLVGKLSFSPAYLELHKLIRIWRIPKYISMLDDVYAKNFVLRKMFKVLVVTVLLSHFVACVRFTFGFDIHGDNHWLPHAPTHELSPKSKYLMSFFWAFGILTGLFEGELPYTIEQFVFTIIVALCGISLFIYLCATFFMISKCESGHTETAEARMNQFKHLLSFHHVPDQLQQQAIGYLKRYYMYTESNDREAMRLLCHSISKDIQVAMLKDMVPNIIFFQDCREQFIIAITSLLEMISLPANVTVFHANDVGDAMYLVNSGVLHVIADGVKVREVRKGNFFGEMAMFLNRPRFATVLTTTYCTLMHLQFLIKSKRWRNLFSGTVNVD
uniref:Cyclic nucleotide-binding domain-containing protein n=1 Tax=Globisporangium ultimum (strain ATCC 200006 / CBS 805.95 / DAOM BR144) TaxID=431595 RepID=K3X7R2_GLOUD